MPYPKYRLRRGLFHWQVGYWDIGYAGADFEHHKFWRKSAALAYLVQLALEGKRVQL